MAAVGLLLNPPKFSQSDVSYVSYESCEPCKKKKTGENGGVRSEHCTGKRFGSRGRVAGSSSAVVTSPWRWPSKALGVFSQSIGSAKNIGGNDSRNAVQELQRQGQGGGKSQAQPPIQQQGWTAQRSYYKEAKQQRRSSSLASQQESRR